MLVGGPPAELLVCGASRVAGGVLRDDDGGQLRSAVVTLAGTGDDRHAGSDVRAGVSRRISWWQVPDRLLGKGIGVYGPELRYFGSAYSQDLGNLTTS